MASLSKRKRILLVDGYIREHENKLQLSNIIPNSINSVIFEFQLLIEKWNKQWSNPMVNIIDDDQCIVEIENNGTEDDFYVYHTVYGDHVAKYGENFLWKLEIIKGKNCDLSIGIIPNREEVLVAKQSTYTWFENGGYLWDGRSGMFAYEEKAKVYSKKNTFSKKRDSLHYIVNDEDYRNALKIEDCTGISNDNGTEFRLAVCLGSADTDEAVILEIDGEEY